MKYGLTIPRSVAEELPDWIDGNELLDCVRLAFGTTKKRSAGFTAEAGEWQSIFLMLEERAAVLLDIADDARCRYEMNEARRTERLSGRVTEWVNQSRSTILATATAEAK